MMELAFIRGYLLHQWSQDKQKKIFCEAKDFLNSKYEFTIEI